jgi:hypothetical protein
MGEVSREDLLWFAAFQNERSMYHRINYKNETGGSRAPDEMYKRADDISDAALKEYRLNPDFDKRYFPNE